jgi:hypothetical protein
MNYTELQQYKQQWQEKKIQEYRETEGYDSEVDQNILNGIFNPFRFMDIITY